MLKLSPVNQEALKVAIAFCLSIIVAIALGWEKPYWAAITVVVIAANENYNTAIKHGRNRLLGTIMGIAFAITSIHFFAQDRELFILSLLGFSAFCVYMSGCERYGYAFKMAFTVGVIIAAMGQFNNTTTFNFAVLRVQETALGALSYSLIFQFLWPKNTETVFKSQIQNELEVQINQIKYRLATMYTGQQPKSYDSDANSLKSLQILLKDAIEDSPKIYSESLLWRKLVAYLVQNHDQLHHLCNSDFKKIEKVRNSYLAIKELQQIVSKGDMAKINQLKAVSEIDPVTVTSNLMEELKRSLFHDYGKRLIYVLRAQAALMTSYAMWIYFPTPAGILFPLIASSLINALYDVPSMFYKYTVIGIIGFSTVILLEFIFLMPKFTEIYELAAFYFINIFLIWKLFSRPQFSVLRVLGGNLLVMMTMSALYLTPTYTITQSLNTLIFIFIVLLIIRFYTLLTEEISTVLKI